MEDVLLSLFPIASLNPLCWVDKPTSKGLKFYPTDSGPPGLAPQQGAPRKAPLEKGAGKGARRCACWANCLSSIPPTRRKERAGTHGGAPLSGGPTGSACTGCLSPEGDLREEVTIFPRPRFHKSRRHSAHGKVQFKIGITSAEWRTPLVFSYRGLIGCHCRASGNPELQGIRQNWTAAPRRNGPWCHSAEVLPK